MILSKDADSVISLFEALGFEKRHGIVADPPYVIANNVIALDNEQTV